MLQNLLRALELDGLWDALSSCLTVVSVLEVTGSFLKPTFFVCLFFLRVFLFCLFSFFLTLVIFVYLLFFRFLDFPHIAVFVRAVVLPTTAVSAFLSQA